MIELRDTLNVLINRSDLSVKTTELSNKLFEALEMIKNCIGDKKLDGNDFDEFYKSINGIKKYLTELEKEEKGRYN